ncbi:MAG: 16S rRNA (cytosine(967)-C(5))-methyltransferase RsmB [Clostridiaceae bacterium]|nr:16S rRNA (cytosine(967)-C(5))-methyltransferase RsmB [Clostridiaceae bacterium]
MTAAADAAPDHKPIRRKRSADQARLAAARILQAVLEEGAYANLSSAVILNNHRLSPLDRRFASALVYGTLSRITTIDWLLGKVSRRPLPKLDPWVRTLLRMGVWQLYWGRSIPAPAAIDESVRLAGERGNQAAPGYVNALLRQLAREPVAIPENNWPVRTGLPSELFGYLRKWYGQPEALALAETFLQDDSRITVRANLLRITAEQLTAVLQADGVDAARGLYCPEAVSLDLQGRPLDRLAAYRDGLMTAQDEAAMLVGRVADPRQGWQIVDLCAAPGGKTCHLAERTANRSPILALDIHPERLKLVDEHAKRLGLTAISCLTADASADDPDDRIAAADLVLADVPCSGLGLLGRKPEIRLHMNHERILDLYPLQAAILRRAAALTKPGGILIYSTCTINPAENIERIHAFLQEQAGLFRLEPIDDKIPAALLQYPDLAEEAAAGWLQILPHRHKLDGFFIARLKRGT